MFDAAVAALEWADGSSSSGRPKTHGGLTTAFGLRIVRSGLMDASFGRGLSRVQELRLSGDYITETVPNDMAAAAVEEAKLFVAAGRLSIDTPRP